MMDFNQLLEQAVEIACKSPIIPDDGLSSGGVTIEEFLYFDASDAVEMGIVLLHKDSNGKPKFHWYSDIRSDEYDDAKREALRRLLRPVLEFALNESKRGK